MNKKVLPHALLIIVGIMAKVGHASQTEAHYANKELAQPKKINLDIAGDYTNADDHKGQIFISKPTDLQVTLTLLKHGSHKFLVKDSQIMEVGETETTVKDFYFKNGTEIKLQFAEQEHSIKKDGSSFLCSEDDTYGFCSRSEISVTTNVSELKSAKKMKLIGAGLRLMLSYQKTDELPAQDSHDA